MSVFEKWETKVYKYRYRCELLMSDIHGGVPKDKKVARKWLEAIILEGKDEAIKAMVETTMIEMGVDLDAPMDKTTLDGVLDEAVNMRQLSGFYRHPETEQLCVRGRHVKAMIKEAANIRYAKDRWGPTKKGTRSFFAEHVFVLEDWIPLGRTAPDGVDQRFVHTFRGSGIQYDEYVEDVKISFTVSTDHKFTEAQWGMLWVTAQHNGLGAARSQGFGTFSVEAWDLID